MSEVFHVTSSRNRESIRSHGLDFSMMGAARGIAGSYIAEQSGSFLALSEWETDWFVRMNNTGGTVDVWGVDEVNEDDLVQSPEGHFYLPGVISPKRLRLVRVDIPPER